MIVEPCAETLMHFIADECPEVLPQIIKAAEKRMTTLDEDLRFDPGRPCTTLEATLEYVLLDFG